MLKNLRNVVAWMVFLAWAGTDASAQNLFVERPQPYVGPPPTQKEKDRRESLYKYTYGLLCEKEDRLLEALSSFEDAAKLDPEAPGVFKAQVPLLLLLDRPRDALAAVKRVLQLDADDHETWFLAARLHKVLGELKEYRAALDKGLAIPGLVQNQPQLAQQLYFDLAHSLETTDELAAAIVAYGESAKILDHPDAILDHGPFLRESIITKSAETYEKIGDLQRKLRDFDAAVKSYRTAQARHPDSAARINLNLARVHRERNAPADALAAIDAYLQLQPQGTEAYQFKIETLAKLNRSGDILPWLERASGADKHNVNLKLILAQQYALQKRVPQAEAAYLALADEAPSEEVYRGLFQLPRKNTGLFVLAHFDKAVKLASKKPIEAGSMRAGEQARAMLALLRDDAPIARQLLDAAHRTDQANKDLNYETRFFLAVLADKYGKLGQAEAFYRHALSTPGINEAPLYSGLLKILGKAHKYEEILVVCDDGLKNAQFTNPLLFYNEIAKAQARLGNFTKAEAAAKKAIDSAADRDRFFAVHLQVRIFVQGEKFAQAEAVCKKMLEETTVPGDALEVRYLLSSVYSAWKKLDAAETQLLTILKSDPTNATANNDLGYIWADHNKNLKEAEDLIRKAIDLDRHQRKLGAVDDRDNAAYVDSLGWVLFRRGDLDGACKELERAVALPDGDDPTLWDHLGDVYARLGRLVQAQSAYERSIQIFEEHRTRPRDERFRDARRKLEQIKAQVRAK
jgi:tetratricopeptide (TPR) repeat protein